ncbi:MAG: hypothetical protein AB7F35_31400 [Acetobacteraceae bacterium]
MITSEPDLGISSCWNPANRHFEDGTNIGHTERIFWFLRDKRPRGEDLVHYDADGSLAAYSKRHGLIWLCGVDHYALDGTPIGSTRIGKRDLIDHFDARGRLIGHTEKPNKQTAWRCVHRGRLWDRLTIAHYGGAVRLNGADVFPGQ